MIKNKGLNLLLTVAEVALLTLIVNFIDLACDSNGSFILGTIFSGLIWVAFLVYKDLLDDPFYSIARIAKNIALICLLGFGIVFILLSSLSYFSDVTSSLVGGTIFLSTAFAFALALYASSGNGEFFLEHSIFVPAGIAIVSGILSIILSFISAVATVVGIILIVGCVLLTVIAFKNDWIKFISMKTPKVYMPHGSPDEKPKKLTLDPDEAMENLANRFNKKSYIIQFAHADMYPRIEYCESDNKDTAYFEVVVVVNVTSMSGSTRINWDSLYDTDLKRVWKDFTDEMTKAHAQEVDRLLKAGVNCSSIRKILIKPIDTKTTYKNYARK